jgi:hypothetical protein
MVFIGAARRQKEEHVMVRFKLALLALTTLLAAGSLYAQAPLVPQGSTQPYSPPVVSPYLNLLNRGNPAINYYGIVRPEVQEQQQLQRLQFGLARTNAEVETAATTGFGVTAATGHSVGFMTQATFFNTVNVRGR